MFCTGFQSFAFQSVGSGAASTTGGLPHYTYVPAYQRQEAAQREKIRREKTEAEKLASVINEYKRKEQTVSDSILLASEKRQAELLSIQNELINEINRLLMVKAEMMARIKRSEEALILMIALRRRRLRAF